MKKNLPLLTETFSFKLIKGKLTESSENGTTVVSAKGQFGKADVPTANRRVYPLALWERELETLLPRMKKNEVYGELDHPGDGTTKLQRVSHLITNVEIQPDGTIVGEAKILPNTRNGKQLLGILKDGGAVGVSSRGFGSVEQNAEGYDVVQDDFQLLTWDFVADPAASGSYPEFTHEHKKPEIKVKPVEEDTVKTKGKESLKESYKENKTEQDEFEGEPQDDLDNSLETDEACGDDHADKMEALVAKIRKEESEKLTAKLSEMIKSKEDEIKESIRSELSSDPTIAGAKLALESVKQTLRPYIIGEDIDQEIGSRDKQIESMTNDLQAKDAQLGEYKAITKELGYKLRVEQAIGDFPNKKEIRHRIGDVTRFESLEQLDAKLSHVLKAMKEEETRFEEKLGAKDKIISELRDSVKSLQDQYKKSLDVAESFAIKAYIEKSTAHHPKGFKIKQIAEARGVRSAKEVDAIIEQFSALKTRGETLKQKIQKRLGTRPQSRTLVEDQVKSTLPKKTRGEEVLPGVDMDDLDEISKLGN